MANFQIIDTDEQLAIVKKIIKENTSLGASIDPKDTLRAINKWKTDGLRSHSIEPRNPHQETYLLVYQIYEGLCKQSSLVDFQELLLAAVELAENLAVRDYFHSRYQQIFVDEFQDTNAIQYRLLGLISGEQAALTIVGDDDQSIYGWRGAKVENLQLFLHQHPEHQLIRLEQNYRSTSAILEGANAVIAKNPSRIGKKLWTEANGGVPIQIVASQTGYEEAEYIVKSIQAQAEQGMAYDEFAILYRSNASSRLLEEALIKKSIPYVIYSGTRFYERAEIKNLLAYLRLLVNQDDDMAFARIVNFPPRGIGDKTIGEIVARAEVASMSLWRAGKALVAEPGRNKGGMARLSLFFELLEELQNLYAEKTLALSEFIERIIEKIAVREYYRNTNRPEELARIENMNELVEVATEYHAFDEPLLELLSNLVLDGAEEQQETAKPSVQLMTVHTAKGLEFPCVYIVCCEEGMFPHEMSKDDPKQLEEERRLCYVAITRARQFLYMTYAQERHRFGQYITNPPSRFLEDLPEDCVEFRSHKFAKFASPSSYKKKALSAHKKTPSSNSKPVSSDISPMLGAKVKHPSFGKGVILNIAGSGASAKYQIKFQPPSGLKWIMANFAELEFL